VMCVKARKDEEIRSVEHTKVVCTCVVAQQGT